MKTLTFAIGSLAAAALSAWAAPVQPHHLSARPIQSVPVTKSDRAFLSDVAAEIILQTIAAKTLMEFTDNQYFVESAQFTLKTLREIHEDLDELAKARGIALPLEGSVEKPRDFERFMNGRNGAFQREYERYAQRNTRRLAERFRDASNDAVDPEVRSFAMRHARWVEAAHRETRGLISTPAVVAVKPGKVASGRVVEIFEPPTSVPLAAAESPISPGGSR
jgi:uncharacterized protein DUF4142